MKSCLYYVPVSDGFLGRWEYYLVDRSVLEFVFEDVRCVSSFWRALTVIFKVDVIYCWWWHRSLPIILIAKLLRKRVVCTGAIHMFDQKTAQDFYGSKTIFFRIACRLALAVCDRNLFISYDQFQSITSHVQVKNPVVVRSSLMKGSSWRENLDAREALRRPSRDSLNVGFFCWLTCDQIDRKGFSETYDALVALNAAGTGFVYKLIVGGASGDALPYLTDLAKTGLLDMELRLDLSHELKAQYFADIDIFVNVSSYEGFGNASLEAMSFGVPVVVSRFGAAPEVVGEAGAVVFDITSSNIAAGINAVAEKLLRQDGGFKSAITIQLEKFSFEARRQGLTAALLG